MNEISLSSYDVVGFFLLTELKHSIPMISHPNGTIPFLHGFASIHASLDEK